MERPVAATPWVAWSARLAPLVATEVPMERPVAATSWVVWSARLAPVVATETTEAGAERRAEDVDVSVLPRKPRTEERAPTGVSDLGGGSEEAGAAALGEVVGGAAWAAGAVGGAACAAGAVGGAGAGAGASCLPCSGVSPGVGPCSTAPPSRPAPSPGAVPAVPSFAGSWLPCAGVSSRLCWSPGLRPCSTAEPTAWRPFPSPDATPPMPSFVSFRPPANACMVGGGERAMADGTPPLQGHVMQKSVTVTLYITVTAIDRGNVAAGGDDVRRVQEYAQAPGPQHPQTPSTRTPLLGASDFLQASDVGTSGLR